MSEIELEFIELIQGYIKDVRDDMKEYNSELKGDIKDLKEKIEGHSPCATLSSHLEWHSGWKGIGVNVLKQAGSVLFVILIVILLSQFKSGNELLKTILTLRFG